MPTLDRPSNIFPTSHDDGRVDDGRISRVHMDYQLNVCLIDIAIEGIKHSLGVVGHPLTTCEGSSFPAPLVTEQTYGYVKAESTDSCPSPRRCK